MKHLKKFESFKTNEEIAGMALLAGIGLAFAAGALYDKAKQMWSKNVTSSKYEKTGKTEEVRTADGKTQLIEEYQGDDGNTYWGYDHQYDPSTDSMSSNTGLPSDDVYTAIFKVEDLNRLKKFLQGIKVKTSRPEYDYLDKPKAVDMIYRKTLKGHGHGLEAGNY